MNSSCDGKVEAILVESGAEVKVGQALLKVACGGANVPPPKTKAAAAAPAADKAAPADSSKKTESKAPAAAASASPAAKPSAAASGSNTSMFVGDRSEKRVAMSKMRQRIAQRLKDSQNVAAMLTTFQEVDMTNLIELRNKYKDEFEKTHGVKLGFMSAFVKVISAALTSASPSHAHTHFTLSIGINGSTNGGPGGQRHDRRCDKGDCLPQLRGCVGGCGLTHRPRGACAAKYRDDDIRGEYADAFIYKHRDEVLCM